MPKEEEKQPKIMTKPLPDILDELEDYIRRVEDAVNQAQQAARESREAATVARVAGEEAGVAARKAAEAAVARVEKAAMDEIQALKTGLQQALKVALDALALAQAMNLGIAEASKAYNQEIEKL